VLLLVFATALWPYSGFGFNQPLTTLFLWAAVLGATAPCDRPWRFAAAGACAGLALLTRHEMAAAAIMIALFVAVRADRVQARALLWYAVGLAPMTAVWCALNWWRFGNPLESGYLRDTTPGYGGSIVSGAMGLLCSPYASLILYAPIVLLAVPGWRAMWRRNRAATLLFMALFLGYFLLYASLRNWMAGRSYGPRYLVPFLPALVLPLAFWSPSPRGRRTLIALAAVSLLVQVPGVFVDYSKVRMTRSAAGGTVGQETSWSAMPLLLNARAAAANAGAAAAFLAGSDPPERVTLDRADLSSSLSFSLDLWWLYLAYLGLIGRSTALAIAGTLAAASAFCLRTAWLTAASPSNSVPRR
jgi:hypothetical protein